MTFEYEKWTSWGEAPFSFSLQQLFGAASLTCDSQAVNDHSSRMVPVAVRAIGRGRMQMLATQRQMHHICDNKL